jgi:hypothetical protein
MLSGCSNETFSPPTDSAVAPNGAQTASSSPSLLNAQCSQFSSSQASYAVDGAAPAAEVLDAPNSATYVPLRYITLCRRSSGYVTTPTCKKCPNPYRINYEAYAIGQVAIYRLAEWDDPRYDYYLINTRTLSTVVGYKCEAFLSISAGQWMCGDTVENRLTGIEVGAGINVSPQPVIVEYSPKTVNTGKQNVLQMGFALEGSIKAGSPEVRGGPSFLYRTDWQQAAVNTTVDANTGEQQGYVRWKDDFPRPYATFSTSFNLDPIARSTYETPHAVMLKVKEGSAFNVRLTFTQRNVYHPYWYCGFSCGDEKGTAIVRDLVSNPTVRIEPPRFDVDPGCTTTAPGAPCTVKLSVSSQKPTPLKIVAEIPQSSLQLGWLIYRGANGVVVIDRSTGTGTQIVQLYAPKDPSLVGKQEFINVTTTPDCATNSLESVCTANSAGDAHKSGKSVRIEYVR